MNVESVVALFRQQNSILEDLARAVVDEDAYVPSDIGSEFLFDEADPQAVGDLCTDALTNIRLLLGRLQVSEPSDSGYLDVKDTTTAFLAEARELLNHCQKLIKGVPE